MARTVGIAAIAAGVIAWRSPMSWAVAFLLAMWPSFGGHWLEVAFLNRIRPRLPQRRAAQVTARLAVWCAGGVAMWGGMVVTARLFAATRPPQPPPWWLAGPAFVAIELVAHA